MPRFPYPAQLTNKDRQNLDSLSKDFGVRSLCFSFSAKEIDNPKAIGVVPKRHLIIGPLAVTVEEGFSGSSPQLFIGTGEDRGSIGRATIGPKGVREAIANSTGDFQILLTKDIRILVSVGSTPGESGTAPTSGKGYGVLLYVRA